MRLTKDLASGIMFIAAGLGAMFIARDYALGNAARMGPGFFPMMLAGAIIFVGAMLMLRSLLGRDGSKVLAEWKIKPLFFVIAAVLAFGLLVDATGLIVAIAALVVISRFGSKEGGILELGLMVVLLTLLAIGIFIYGLDMPFRLTPR